MSENPETPETPKNEDDDKIKKEVEEKNEEKEEIVDDVVEETETGDDKEKMVEDVVEETEEKEEATNEASVEDVVEETEEKKEATNEASVEDVVEETDDKEATSETEKVKDKEVKMPVVKPLSVTPAPTPAAPSLPKISMPKLSDNSNNQTMNSIADGIDMTALIQMFTQMYNEWVKFMTQLYGLDPNVTSNLLDMDNNLKAAAGFFLVPTEKSKKNKVEVPGKKQVLELIDNIEELTENLSQVIEKIKQADAKIEPKVLNTVLSKVYPDIKERLDNIHSKLLTAVKPIENSVGGSSSLFDYIIDPNTNKKLSIFNRDGRNLLKKYIQFYKNYEIV